MEKPQDFPKALCMLQIFEIVLYVVAAVVIYYYVGNDVASPALGSAGPIMKKVAYGIAIPTVCFVCLAPLCFVRTTDISRLSVPEWSTAMSVSSTSMSVSSATRRSAWASATWSRLDRGWALD